MLAEIFVPAANFVLAVIFFASKNFCASSKFCAGSNFCAGRNICVLFVLSQVNNYGHGETISSLTTPFWGKFEEAIN